MPYEDWNSLVRKYECRKGLVVSLFNLSKTEYNGQHAIVDDVDSRDRNYIYVYLGQRRKRVGVQCIKIPLDEADEQETIVIRLGNLQNQSFNGALATLDYFTANGLVYVKVLPDGKRKKVMIHCCTLVAGSMRGLSLSLPSNMEPTSGARQTKPNSVLDADIKNQASKLSSRSGASADDIKRTRSGSNASSIEEYPSLEPSAEGKNGDEDKKEECTVEAFIRHVNDDEKEKKRQGEEKRDSGNQRTVEEASGSPSVCNDNTDTQEDTNRSKKDDDDKENRNAAERTGANKENDARRHNENTNTSSSIGGKSCNLRVECSPSREEGPKKDDLDSPLRRDSWRKSFMRRRELFSKQSP